MPGRKPRKNWIYMIDPKRVVLRCRNDHKHIYDISGPSELNCADLSCSLTLNSSRVMRGTHPHIIWSEYQYGKFHAYHAIPLSSKDTFRGLPTAYPIRPNSENGLTKNSLALIHQLTMIDAECFKNTAGNWMMRLGKITSNQREDIGSRLKFALDLSEKPSQDWFTQNASPELLKQVFLGLESDQRELAVSSLLELL